MTNSFKRSGITSNSGQIPEPEFNPGKCLSPPAKVKLTSNQRKILLLLGREHAKYTQRDLKNHLNIPKSTLSDGLSRLEKIGLISTDNTWPRSYTLTRAGKKQYSGFLVGYDENLGIYDRSHAWKFKVQVLKFPEHWPDGWKSWSIKNWSPSSKKFVLNDGLEVEVRRNAEKSLSIIFSEVPGADAQATEDKAYWITYSVLDILKKDIPGIVFGLAELADVTLTGCHHALINDPYAVKCKQIKTSIKGKYVDIDASKGKPETEFNNPDPVLNRENCLKYHKFVEDVAIGDIDPYSMRDSISSLSVFIEDKLTPTLNDFAVNLQAHTNTAKANLEAANALKEAINRFDKFFRLVLWPVNFFYRVFRRK